MAGNFSIEAAERRFGPAAAAEARRSAAEAAARLRPEQIEFLRALFASVRVSRSADSEADAA
ncbi:hypothetical protein [Streptomyces sp. YKOK-I1]